MWKTFKNLERSFRSVLGYWFLEKSKKYGIRMPFGEQILFNRVEFGTEIPNRNSIISCTSKATKSSTAILRIESLNEEPKWEATNHLEIWFNWIGKARFSFRQIFPLIDSNCVPLIMRNRLETLQDACYDCGTSEIFCNLLEAIEKALRILKDCLREPFRTV